MLFQRGWALEGLLSTMILRHAPRSSLSSLLRWHTSDGNFKNVSRGFYSSALRSSFSPYRRRERFAVYIRKTHVKRDEREKNSNRIRFRIFNNIAAIRRNLVSRAPELRELNLSRGILTLFRSRLFFSEDSVSRECYCNVLHLFSETRSPGWCVQFNRQLRLLTVDWMQISNISDR